MGTVVTNGVDWNRKDTETIQTALKTEATELHLTNNTSATKGVTFADGTRQATSAVDLAVFAAEQEPTGFLDRTAVLSWTNTSPDRTFTITGNHTIYINGVATVKTTASIQIANTTALHFIYYNTSGVLSESTTFPGFYVPIIASVYWNSSTAKGILAEERHGITMDGATHGYLHQTVGARYISGLTLTVPTNATFSMTSGFIADEDITVTIGAATTCDVFYKDGSADYKWDAAQAPLYGTSLRYNNGNTLTAVPVTNYVALWVFGSNAVSTVNKQIAVVIGQRVDTTLANARANNNYNTLSLGTLPSAELKLLYRVIYRNVGGTATYIELADYRSVSNLPSGTYVATAHSTLTGLSADDHLQYLLLAGRGGQTITDTLVVNTGATALTALQLTTDDLTGDGQTDSPTLALRSQAYYSGATHYIDYYLWADAYASGGSPPNAATLKLQMQRDGGTLYTPVSIGIDRIVTLGNGLNVDSESVGGVHGIIVQPSDDAVGVYVSTPYYALDIGGDTRIRSTSALRFGGTGAADGVSYLSLPTAGLLQLKAAALKVDPGAANTDGLLLEQDARTSAGSYDSHPLLARARAYPTGDADHALDWQQYADVTDFENKKSTWRLDYRLDSGGWVNKLAVTDDGNVGIGDDAPDFDLDVAGDIRIQGANKLYFGGTGSGDNDCNLYKAGSDALQTDDALNVVGALTENSVDVARWRGVSAGAPGTDVQEGDLYYDSGDSKVYIRANSGWVALT